MVRPVERTATGSAAETAGSGLGFGLLGAIAGGLIATAIFVGGGMALGGAAGGFLTALFTDVGVTQGISIGLGLTEATATGSGLAWLGGAAGAVIGGVTGVASGGIPMGAAIGAGGGALAGITGKSKQIKGEAQAAHKMRAGHSAAVQQQIVEQRAQAVEAHTPGIYNQGVQDGQAAVMQQLQQAAMQQQAALEQQQPGLQQDPMQMAHAEPEAGHDVEKASFADKILNERGGHKADTHAEQAIASKEQAAGEASLA